MTSELMGLALVVAGVQFSVLANTFVKLLSGVPMLQLMQARFLLQWIVTVLYGLVLKSRGHPINLLGKPGSRVLLAVRSCAFSGALACLWTALRVLPVGEATAITYLNPIVCGWLAMTFFQEQLGWKFYAQAAASCVGVLLVVNPFAAATLSNDVSAEAKSAGVILAALGCVAFATGNCMVRALIDVHPVEVQVYQDSVTALVLLPIAQAMTGGVSSSFDWSAWTEYNVVLLVLFTLAGTLASVFVIMGYTYAPANKAALFMYLEVSSAFSMQVFYFGEVPGPLAVLGAGIIVSAALARLWYEMRSISMAADGESDEPSFARQSSFDRQSSFTRQLSPVMSPMDPAFPPMMSPNLLPVMFDLDVREEMFSPLPSPGGMFRMMTDESHFGMPFLHSRAVSLDPVNSRPDIEWTPAGLPFKRVGTL